MSERSKLLEKHCNKLIKLFEKYDNCLEFEKTIGVKCDVSEIVEQIEIEVSIINSLL